MYFISNINYLASGFTFYLYVPTRILTTYFGIYSHQPKIPEDLKISPVTKKLVTKALLSNLALTPVCKEAI